MSLIRAALPSVPLDGRDGVVVAQFLGTAADAWAAAKTEGSADCALGRASFLRLLERGAGVALRDVVEDAGGLP